MTFLSDTNYQLPLGEMDWLMDSCRHDELNEDTGYTLNCRGDES